MDEFWLDPKDGETFTPPPQPPLPPRQPPPPIIWNEPTYPPVPLPPSSAPHQFAPPPQPSAEWEAPPPYAQADTEYLEPDDQSSPADEPPSEQASPAPKPRGPIIALIAGIGLLLVALVVWLVVSPLMKGSPGTPIGPSSNPPSLPTNTWSSSANPPQPLSGDPRVPDIVTQPAGWSQPVTVVSPDDAANTAVYDTGIDDIVIVSSKTNLYGINLDGPEVLWSVPYLYYYVTLDNGDAVISDTDNQLALIDVHTGQLTSIGTFPGGYVLYANGEMAINSSWDGQGETYCARDYSSFSVCQWQAQDSKALGPEVFGDGQWVNTAGGVLDIATGQPATFGSDAISTSMDDVVDPRVFYAGPADGVIRVEYHPNSGATSITAWDTTTDKAKGKAVSLPGNTIDESIDSPVLLAGTYDSPTRINAYSWQTGKQLWKISPKLTEDIPVYTVFQNFIFLYMGTNDNQKPAQPSRPNSAIINEQTGQYVALTSQYASAVEAGQRVIYMADDQSETGGDQITARDGQSATLATLWTMKSPKKNTVFQAVANHVIGISTDTGELWVLQP